jgi:hypothetical protein
MCNTLSLKWILVFACIAAACGVSPGDAAERIIRPRRFNRPASRTVALPAPSAPFAEDGSGQAPLPGLSSPDSALLPSEFPVLSNETYQEEAANPPRAPRSGKRARRPWGWTIDKELELQSEFAARGPEEEWEQDEEEEIERSDSGAKITASGPPRLVPDRMDFDAPLRITGEVQNTELRPPAPAFEEALPEEQLVVVVDSPEAEREQEPEPDEDLPQQYDAAAQPTPAEVENYRRRLEFRLLERYNNLPEYAGEVGKVSVVLSKPLQPSLDGTRLRAEFDQIVYDTWGKRIPALEKEYYVVTFGSGGARQVRSDPSIRVGLNLERSYSEPGPDSDIEAKIRTLPSDHAFRTAPSPEAPKAKMPDWWRPEFRDDGY